MWVPDHSSIKGNGKAEMHAKNTASSTSLDITPLTTFQDTIRTLQLISMQAWKNMWAKQKTKLNEIKTTIYSSLA